MTRSSVDRVNRLLWFGLGLIVLGVGAYTLLRSFGVLGDARSDQTILTRDVSVWVARNEAWFWPAVGAAGVLVMLAGLWWVRSQVPRRSPDVDSGIDGPVDTDVAIDSRAIEQAIESDLNGQGSVRRAKARVIGVATPGIPEVLVDLTVGDDLSTRDLERDVVAPALGRLARALEVEDVPSRVRVHFDDSERHVV